ncbi:MAG: hypothetical protein GX557_11625 [Chloroflexi bacterium]|nr:hypothetical protein [Chloroflexota bacterium]
MAIECVIAEPRAQSDAPDEGGGEPAPDLFSAPRAPSPRAQLLSHPAVKELQRRGGQVSQVQINDKQEDGRGQ